MKKYDVYFRTFKQYNLLCSVHVLANSKNEARLKAQWLLDEAHGKLGYEISDVFESR